MYSIRHAVSSPKSVSTTAVAVEAKLQKCGPVELDAASLKHVGGGLAPKGTWSASVSVATVEAPKGTW